jgi:biotin transport system ATP-binding protein
MTLPGISLIDAGFSVPGKVILAGITADLTEHRIGILGRNGSGKSTLLRLMAGLIAPTSGSVFINGLDPAGDRKAMLAQIGILFQNPDHQILFPTVIEELSFGLRQINHPDPTARAREILGIDGRLHWETAPTHSLSQGQRHYLCLLSILAMEPATILLDEPLAGLDLPTRARLSRRFHSLPQRLITVTHDPETVATYDRVLWLESGHIRADGPAADITAAFRAEMARLGEADADTDLPR